MKARNFLFIFLKNWANLGLMGVLVPEEYGGAGLGYFEYKASDSGNSKSMWFHRIKSCST